MTSAKKVAAAWSRSQPGFQRRLHAGQGTRDVALEPGRAHWLPAQTHAGENIGSTPTHVLFIELKEEAAQTRPATAAGPDLGG